MALTYLLKQAACEDPTLKVDSTAFIIDHKARANSTEEAQNVAKWAKDLGKPIRARWMLY